MEKQAEPIQLKVWMLTAVGALLVLKAPNSGLLSNIILGVLGGGVCLLVARFCAAGKYGRWMYLLQWVWSCVMLLYFLGDAAAVWNARGDVVLPICLMLTGLWGSRNGVGRSAAVGSTLVWFVVPLLLGIIAASVENVRLDWAASGLLEWEKNLIPVLLLPSLLWILGMKETGARGKWFLLIPAIGAVTAWVVRGTVPAYTDWELGFTELSKSVELFGRTMRLEALSAFGLTLGMYCVISLLTSVSETCARNVNPKLRGWSTAVTGAVVIVSLLCKITISDGIAAIGCLICWVFVPVITQLIVSEKKS